jgi:hypothetical protein
VLRHDDNDDDVYPCVLMYLRVYEDACIMLFHACVRMCYVGPCQVVKSTS